MDCTRGSKPMSTDAPIIDAYTHCGLSKYTPIEDVRATMEAAGVERAVLAQHLGEFDNRYLADVVAADPEHLAGVCMVDHASPASSGDLRACRDAGFKGVRYPSDVLKDAPHLFDEAAALGLILVLYLPDGIAGVVEDLGKFLKRCPSARVVLTHLANPDLSVDPKLEACRRQLELAEFEGVFVQVSAMKMFSDYPHEVLYGLVGDVAERFGTSRVLWGSNYPVVGDVEDYRRDLQMLLDGKLPVPKEAIPAIAGGNAGRLWFGD